MGPGELYSTTDITFENIKLINLLEVKSSATVGFGSNSSSEQIVVTAKNINIIASGEQRGQFIASGRLTTENCTFKYPSVVAVLANPALKTTRSKKDQARLNIGAGTTVEGSVVYYSKQILSQGLERLAIDPSAKVFGFVYSNKQSEVFGQINGSIMTNNFYFYLSPTTYVNWLNGPTISRTAFEGEFAIPAGYDATDEYTIICEL